MLTEDLARERMRSHLEAAQRRRHTRQVRTLRRATRLEYRAERRLVQAWRRAAELRRAVESAGY